MIFQNVCVIYALGPWFCSTAIFYLQFSLELQQFRGMQHIQWLQYFSSRCWFCFLGPFSLSFCFCSCFHCSETQTNAIRKFNLNLLRFSLNIQWQNTRMVATQTFLCKINNAMNEHHAGLERINTDTSMGFQTKRCQNACSNKNS